MKAYSAVVSQVVGVGFEDLAKAAEELPGSDVAEGQVRLEVRGRVGTGLAGGIRFGGTLRTTSWLPPVQVEVVVSPWSAGCSEVAIHPISNIGQLDSRRANRFYEAARSVLPLVVDYLNVELPSKAPAALALAA
jgi:hypothetical protein